MIARLQKSMKEKDQGFTLIELLVVIVIIGILAAVAIPILLNQRKKAVDASIKSDLKGAATQVENWSVDNPSVAVTAANQSLTNGGTGTGAMADVKVSPGNTVTLVASAGSLGAYCLFAYNSAASEATSATDQMAYYSRSGGLQFSIVNATTCA